MRYEYGTSLPPRFNVRGYWTRQSVRQTKKLNREEVDLEGKIPRSIQRFWLKVCLSFVSYSIADRYSYSVLKLGITHFHYCYQQKYTGQFI